MEEGVIIREEGELLKRIIYKAKNQHRATMYFRKMVQLEREVRRYVERGGGVGILRSMCVDLYVLVSSNVEKNNFMSLTLVVMGICARIFSLSLSLGERRGGELGGEIEGIFR